MSNPPPADAMEVDAARRHASTATLRCYRCRCTRYLYHDCPNAANIRFLNIDEIDEEVGRLLSLKDAHEAQTRQVAILEVKEIPEEPKKDFLKGRE
ncbi:hypothetical protein Clacol_003397 [Clathrus columnatus]|uniref:Uncharacterized protein n=1 Tax=Clathrus columnatus TaxID=1419009 RepID=A0AAV5AB71_9AGAM|nr:hypothetical protein Clacol_003397 [Clathrus columnatus]